VLSIKGLLEFFLGNIFSKKVHKWHIYHSPLPPNLSKKIFATSTMLWVQLFKNEVCSLMRSSLKKIRECSPILAEINFSTVLKELKLL